MPGTKAEARREMLAKRDALSTPERRFKSAAIADRLKGLAEYRQSAVILFYVSFRSEVLTRGMIEAAVADGKRVIAPKVDRKGRRLRLFEIKDAAKDLESGYMGIYEPVEARTREAEPQEIDMVVLPGVGFDTSCRRLGYGGGYYDRLIESLKPGASLVALAYDVQVVDEIPSEGHDKKVGRIITELRIITA